ncbi:putative ESAT-6 like protein ESXF [Mycobacterium bohemicum DSM 44277]|uniref:ESAT-6-like protein n=2 Tax=Mycobacterium bohemicum TaxID=56425 RepID=A0A1X1RCL2_MYCBE|nr:WXG100 family type VII secretion target [Mycobacterium bohemicum]MCV6971916.1 WXG100 family type VII secretion target [Mycobacterium bohemicum]ORV02906.1 secretion protein [Mycobacterium bohemicum]CPR11755.1 putative ESAT-6 like protein ESXF [Mycobacterium bohemicum DSM 44277]
MAGEDALRADQREMQDFAASLGGAAEHLAARLAELDDRVGLLLAGWRGNSGSAYASAWELWHHGARQVQQGLALLARLVAEAGAAYAANEAGSARAMRAVRHG